MTGHLGEADHARLARAGQLGLSTDRALDAFDRACRTDRALLVPARLDLTVLRGQDACRRHVAGPRSRPGRTVRC